MSPPENIFPLNETIAQASEAKLGKAISDCCQKMIRPFIPTAKAKTNEALFAVKLVSIMNAGVVAYTFNRR